MTLLETRDLFENQFSIRVCIEVFVKFSFDLERTPNCPFKILPKGRLLAYNQLSLVSEFEESAVRFLSGGVMKSKDLEKKAEQSQRQE